MKGTSRGRWVRRIAQGLNSAPEGEDCSSLLRVNLLIKVVSLPAMLKGQSPL